MRIIIIIIIIINNNNKIIKKKLTGVGQTFISSLVTAYIKVIIYICILDEIYLFPIIIVCIIKLYKISFLETYILN